MGFSNRPFLLDRREDAENATRLDGEWNGKGNTLRVDHRMGLLKHDMKSSKYDNASITT